MQTAFFPAVKMELNSKGFRHPKELCFLSRGYHPQALRPHISPDTSPLQQGWASPGGRSLLPPAPFPVLTASFSPEEQLSSSTATEHFQERGCAGEMLGHPNSGRSDPREGDENETSRKLSKRRILHHEELQHQAQSPLSLTLRSVTSSPSEVAHSDSSSWLFWSPQLKNKG